MRFLKDFFKRTDGGVTPEVILLTAALVSLSLALTFKLHGGAAKAADTVSTTLTEDVGGQFD